MLKEEGQHFQFADACGEFFQRIYRYLQNPVYVEDEREFSSLPYGKSNPSSTLQESSIKKKVLWDSQSHRIVGASTYQQGPAKQTRNR